MDVVVGGGEKWREGVICHSAAFSRASEWRHNLAAEMDATFGDGGREMREGVRTYMSPSGLGERDRERWPSSIDCLEAGDNT